MSEITAATEPAGEQPQVWETSDYESALAHLEQLQEKVRKQTSIFGAFPHLTEYSSMVYDLLSHL